MEVLGVVECLYQLLSAFLGESRREKKMVPRDGRRGRRQIIKFCEKTLKFTFLHFILFKK